MAKINYRNTLVQINGTSFPCDSASISLAGSISERRTNLVPESNAFVGENVVSKLIAIDFPLTQNDPLRSFIYLYDSPFSGSIGAYSFSSGYLTSYSLRADPGQSIQASASLIVLDANESNLQENTSLDYSNFEIPNMKFTSITGSGINFDVDLPISFAYSYSQPFEYMVRRDRDIPTETVYGAKRAELTIATDSISGVQYSSGHDVGVSFVFKNSSLTPVSSLDIYGAIYSKNISLQGNSLHNNTYQILQTKFIAPVSITGYEPTSGYWGQVVSISGSFLQNITYVKFADLSQFNILSVNDYKMTVQVPYGAISGALKLGNFGGLFSVGDFNVLDSGVQILSVNPISGSAYL